MSHEAGKGDAMRPTKHEAYAAGHERIFGGKQAQPERHELQVKGEHPAPCARFCEATALYITESQLRRRIAELENVICQRAFEAQRKPLTDEQIDRVLDEVGLLSPYAVARAIEAAHGIVEQP